MKTAILYTSKHGTTYSIAKHISMALDADVFALDEFDASMLSDYDTIILGTPMYAGKCYGAMELFCRDNLEALLTKKLALFISGLARSERRQQHQLHKSYLKPLLKHSRVTVFVGGAVNLSKLTMSEKLITRTMLKINSDATDINQPAIERLIAAMQA